MEPVLKLTTVQEVRGLQVVNAEFVSLLTTPVLLLVTVTRLSVVLTSLPFQPLGFVLGLPAGPLRMPLRTRVGLLALEASQRRQIE